MSDVYCRFCGGKADLIEKSTGGYAWECPLCGARIPCTKKGRFFKNKGWRSIKQLELAGKCHDILDNLYTTPSEKQVLYRRLAKEIRIPLRLCHFSMMSNDNMKRAYKILSDLAEKKISWDLTKV